MVRPIVRIPDPVLRQRAMPVERPLDPEIQALIADMKDSCSAAEGIGLAAPQLGVSKRVIIINYPQGSPYGLINPELVWKSSGTTLLEEGCLSIPDIVVGVTRPKKVKVRALNEQGQSIEITADDLLAKILQHEIDHLNGVLITDHGQSSPKKP
ncbi:MAG: formylmethionine deformylase, partial [Parcubacteria group bacterium Gr01-1014_106]